MAFDSQMFAAHCNKAVEWMYSHSLALYDSPLKKKMKTSMAVV